MPEVTEYQHPIEVSCESTRGNLSEKQMGNGGRFHGEGR